MGWKMVYNFLGINEKTSRNLPTFDQNVHTVYSNICTVYQSKNHVTTHPEASPSELILSLFKLYPWSQKWPAPGVTCFLTYFRENMKKIFLSKTIWPTALIFGMWHQLVDLYQVCSNYAPGAKNGPARGHMFYIGLYRVKHEKILSSETTRPRALIFGMKHPLVNLF